MHSKSIIVGLALFSMFFGSGNLIFPLDVGRVAGGQFLWGALGFILTAVLVPFMGVVAMVVYNGDYQKFFAFSGKKTGFILTLILLSFWIPFGSGPRCITLS
ncbi:MAG: branched-chain amino acid transport system II carrier protein, partial [Deltaproteobacteria bacterium]|nr:branched-chain amino acid transport system II carrier protein [Deltaproteobacteria bacterium]